MDLKTVYPLFQMDVPTFCHKNLRKRLITQVTKRMFNVPERYEIVAGYTSHVSLPRFLKPILYQLR